MDIKIKSNSIPILDKEVDPMHVKQAIIVPIAQSGNIIVL